MLKIRHILIPTDFSPSAEAAVEQGLDLARRCGAEVHTLHVVGMAGSEPLQAWFNRVMEDMGAAEALRREIAEHAHKAAQRSRDVPLRQVQVEGRDTAREVLRYAEEHDVDLIVMSTHGRRSLLHPTLGGVTGEVLRHADCPVMTLRTKDEDPAPRPVRRILAPIDFSEHAAAALRHARALAGLYGASLALVFVAEERIVPVFNDTGIPTFMALKMPPEVVEQAEAALRQLYEETPGPETPVAFYVRKGRPAHEILECAEEVEADLIVMSTHGVGNDRRFLLGSVTERVVRSAPHAVLTLKAFGKSLVEADAGRSS